MILGLFSSSGFLVFDCSAEVVLIFYNMHVECSFSSLLTAFSQNGLRGCIHKFPD
jgi:hypothetical protein